MRGVAVGEDKEPKPAPALLMEMMEAREALAEARGDMVRMEKLAAEMQVRLDAVVGDLARLLDEGNDQAALAKLGELRFCRRLIREVEDAV